MLQLYDDYIEMSGKKPVGKPDEIPHYQSPPDHLNGYGGHLKSEYIFIDIDDPTEAAILYRIIIDSGVRTIIRKTDKGYHFYFKSTGITRSTKPVKCVLGLTVEYKKLSRKQFEPIKIDGKKREIIRENNEISEIPYFLKRADFAPDFKNMGEGDARNQEFANYQFTLSKNGIEYEQARMIGALINDYVLKQPLSTREFDTVWRPEFYPEVKPKFWNDTGKFVHNIFGDFMMTKHNIININNQLFSYQDGVYKSEFETQHIQKLMIDEIPNIRESQRMETLKYINLKAPVKAMADPRYVLVRNGIYDFVEDELIPHDPDKIFINKIDYNYNVDAYSDLVENTMNKIACDDEEIYFLLCEIAGYTLYRRNQYRFCPILFGEGSNGKSTYLKMIQQLLGHENYSSLSMGDMKNSFKPAELTNKLANIGDDIDDQYIKDTSLIKKLITGETIMVERKGSRSYKLNSYAKLIFSANDLALVNDKSKGWTSRIKIVPFNAEFSPDDDDFDPFITVKLMEDQCMEYFLLLALENMRIVLTKGGFTASKEVDRMTAEYELENNSLLQWYNSEDTPDDLIVGHSRGEITLAYEAYCQDNGIHPLSTVKVGRFLTKQGYAPTGRRRTYEHRNDYEQQRLKLQEG